MLPARVTITFGDHAPGEHRQAETTILSSFIRDNADDPQTVAEVLAALAKGETAILGGGATPVVTVEAAVIEDRDEAEFPDVSELVEALEQALDALELATHVIGCGSAADMGKRMRDSEARPRATRRCADILRRCRAATEAAFGAPSHSEAAS